MGLSCSTELKEKLGLSEKIKENNKDNYPYNVDDDEDEHSSLSKPEEPEARPQLDSTSQQIVLQTWGIIKRDIERVGVVMFMGSVELCPLAASVLCFIEPNSFL